jgi:hypothetical protein
MRFGTYNITGFYRAGSLMTVSRELSRSRSGQMGGQWHCTSRGIYIFLWKGEWEPWIGYTFLFIRKPYQQLRGSNLLVIGCHTERSLVSYHCSKCSSLKVDKIDEMKDSFYEELECIFDKFPKYHMKKFVRFRSQSRLRRRFKLMTGI